MRRLPVSWLLSLLLVFAQTGAVLHELGHLSRHTDTQLRAQPLDDSSICPTCESFAQVANPASGTALSPVVCPVGLLPTPDPDCTVVGVGAPNPRSRGPPQA
jgi:hypothetical protein